MSLNAATIEVLIAKGMSASDILDIARAMEARSDPTAAQRQARYRERQKEKEPVTRNVTRDEKTPPLKNPPDPQKITPPLPPTSPDGLEPPAAELNGSANGHAPPALKPEHLVEAWNDGPGSRGAVTARRLTDARRRKALTFLRRYPIEDITEAIDAVSRSDFLCGRKPNSEFRADLKFLFSDEHMTRLLEGFYDR